MKHILRIFLHTIKCFCHKYFRLPYPNKPLHYKASDDLVNGTWKPCDGIWCKACALGGVS